MKKARHEVAVERETLVRLMMAAQEIVADFESFGTVLQADTLGDYGDHSAIGRLKKAVGEMEAEVNHGSD
jgi:hypothetical protein